MFDIRFIRALRDAKGWSQAQVAAATKINQPRISLYERSERTPTRPHYERLQRVLALGEARDGETQPAFALAVRTDRNGLMLALGNGPRIGIYRDSRTAQQAANIMRGVHRGDKGRIGVVPLWLDAAFGAVMAATAGHASPDAVYLADREQQAENLLAAVIEQALQAADWWDRARSPQQSGDVAALADEFLRRQARGNAAA